MSIILDKKNILAIITSYGLVATTIFGQIFLIPQILKYAGHEQLGLYIILLAGINFAGAGAGWISGALTRMMIEAHANGKRRTVTGVYCTTKILYLGYSIAIGLIVVIVEVFVNWSAKYNQTIPFVAYYLYFLMLYSFATERLTLFAIDKVMVGNIIEIAGQIVGLGLSYVLISIITTIDIVFYCMSTGLIISQVLVYLYLKKIKVLETIKKGLKQVKPNISRAISKYGTSYGKYGLVAVVNQADTLIIGLVLGPKFAAAYYLLWRIPEAALLIANKIPAAYIPAIAILSLAGKKTEAAMIYRKIEAILLFLFAMGAVAFYFLGADIIAMWLDQQIEFGNLEIMLASIALFCRGISLWPLIAAPSLNLTESIFRILAVESVAKISLIWILSSSLEHISPIVVTIATGLTTGLMCAWIIRKEIGD